MRPHAVAWRGGAAALLVLCCCARAVAQGRANDTQPVQLLPTLPLPQASPAPGAPAPAPAAADAAPTTGSGGRVAAADAAKAPAVVDAAASPAPGDGGDGGYGTDSIGARRGPRVAAGRCPRAARAPTAVRRAARAASLVALVPGCGVDGSPFLPPGLDGGCEVQGLLDRRQGASFAFDLPPVAPNATARPYRLLVLLRTVDGDAQLGLSTPDDNGTTDDVPDVVGTQVYATEITSEVLQRRERRRRAAALACVDTPFSDVLLAEPDLSAMRDLHAACCVASRSTSPLCTQFLAAAIAPGHSAGDDLCTMTPMTCDSAVRGTARPPYARRRARGAPFESLARRRPARSAPHHAAHWREPPPCRRAAPPPPQGRLTQLAVAQGGLECPRGLPASLGNLTALRTLDLAFNALGMPVSDVAAILGRMASLENAFLRYTGLTGPLDPGGCALVAPPSLTRLSLSGNANITGALPACMLRVRAPRAAEARAGQPARHGRQLLQPAAAAPPPSSQDATLEELYISQTGLTGALPDAVPRSSPLRLLYAIGAPDRGDDAGLSGTLPASLLASPSLTYLHVGNNALTGGLPRLPAALQLLNVSANALDGTIAGPLPGGLATLDASFNRLRGALPGGVEAASNLTLLDFSANRLTGTLSTALPDGLLVFDVGGNDLTGTLPRTLPGSLAFLGAADNRLSGPLPDLPAPSALRFALLSNNSLTGGLPPSLVNGSAPGLVALELQGNALTGGLEPGGGTAGTGGGGGGRKLLQGGGGGGAAWDAPDLTYLDLSRNQFRGPLPASLGALPALVVLDVSSNALTGGLAPFADALVLNASGDAPELLQLNASNNRRVHRLPARCARCAARAAHCPAQPDRVLDLSNNSLSGALPAWLVTAPASVAEACGQRCGVDVALNGSDMALTCPPPGALQLTPSTAAFLQRAGLGCVDAAGDKVNLLATASGPAPPPAAPGPAGGQDPRTDGAAAAQQPSGGGGGRGGGLAPGAIAGIVIGAVAGAALLAGAAALGARRLRKHAAGWRKEELGGGPHGAALDDEFGMTPAPGAGRGSGGGDTYAHTPYESAQASIEMLSSRKDAA
ncbi:GSO1 [Scenedesmus sp. PABB004]|nr:GSO1 [Scenedesmus sp. PABB004]